jgi:Ca-activated chloride channel family protein
MMSGISWREPLWLLLASVPWLFLVLGLLRGKLMQHRFYDRQLLPWVIANRPVKRKLVEISKFASVVLAWLCFAIAMAGPRTINAVHASGKDNSVDVMLLVDVSRSMGATDILPGRIERVRLELTDLLRRAQGMRFGIVVFAARPHLLVPVTDDINLVESAVQNLRTGLLPTEGSNMTAALRFARQQLPDSNTAGKRAILLVSDGSAGTFAENPHIETVLAEINSDNISIYTLGMATLSGSPLFDTDTGWLTDAGETITSRLNQGLLQTIALRTNGKYASVSDSDAEWRSLYQDGLALHKADAVAIDNASTIEWQEHYHGWLLAGFILFMFAHLGSLPVKALQIKSLVMAVLVLGLLPVHEQATANSCAEAGSAYDAFSAGCYEQAENLYKKIPGYAGRMGQGGSAYFRQEYDAAIRYFLLAVLDASSNEQRADALFNLANSYFKASRYKEAASIYQDVLRYVPQHRAASVNYTYAESLAKETQSVDQREFALRRGRGPRTADAAQNLDVSQGGLTLGDNVENNDIGLPETGEKAIDAPSRLELIESTAKETNKFVDQNWQYEETDVARITAYLNRLQTDESNFWQRLFEVEEGFVAPVEQPRTVPGVKPW